MPDVPKLLPKLHQITYLSSKAKLINPAIVQEHTFPQSSLRKLQSGAGISSMWWSGFTWFKEDLSVLCSDWDWAKFMMQYFMIGGHSEVTVLKWALTCKQLFVQWAICPGEQSSVLCMGCLPRWVKYLLRQIGFQEFPKAHSKCIY